MLYLEPPEMPENPKLLKASILGAPNAGKSTLVNRTQMIILDTPGLVTFKKSKK